MNQDFSGLDPRYCEKNNMNSNQIPSGNTGVSSQSQIFSREEQQPDVVLSKPLVLGYLHSQLTAYENLKLRHTSEVKLLEAQISMLQNELENTKNALKIYTKRISLLEWALRKERAKKVSKFSENSISDLNENQQDETENFNIKNTIDPNEDLCKMLEYVREIPTPDESVSKYMKFVDCVTESISANIERIFHELNTESLTSDLVIYEENSAKHNMQQYDFNPYTDCENVHDGQDL